MTHRSPLLNPVLCCAIVLALTACRGSHNPYAKKLMGSVETSGTQMTGQQPRNAPRTVYVADFALDTANLKGDQGVRGVLPAGATNQGLLGGIGQRLPHPLASGDPQQQSRAIVDTMAESLVSALGDRSIPARRIDPESVSLPIDGWLLQGVFTEVDEGNRIKRAVIGFGQGATQMNVQVGISDLTSTEPRKAFIVFGTVKDPGKMPGAIVTMNPYVAAAKFVMEKNATGRDIRNTADQIVSEVLKYEDTIKRESTARYPGRTPATAQ